MPAAAPDSADQSQTPARPAIELTGLSERSVAGEERIRILLDADDGRMRQTEIVDYLDRSKGTVSKYLSRLEDRGEVVKVRYGRENIIYLPEKVPDAVEPKK